MQFFFSVMQNVLPLVSDDSTDTSVDAKKDIANLSKKERREPKK